MSSITKTYYTHDDIDQLTQTILMQMHRDNWVPDYIVGLTRGGLIPAVHMSHYLNIPMFALKVSLRDSEGNNESNWWMAEDAWGYGGIKPIVDKYKQKKILIVDDINDTGATLDWIIQDWQSNCLPKSEHWNSVWSNNVRFAVLVDNLSSTFSKEVNYAGTEINKAEKDEWIVFPWEK